MNPFVNSFFKNLTYTRLLRDWSAFTFILISAFCKGVTTPILTLSGKKYSVADLLVKYVKYGVKLFRLNLVRKLDISSHPADLFFVTH